MIRALAFNRLPKPIASPSTSRLASTLLHSDPRDLHWIVLMASNSVSSRNQTAEDAQYDTRFTPVNVKRFMTLSWILSTLGEEVEDPDVEAFELFSQTLPSQNLGYLDKTTTALEVSIAGRDFIIHQSPTLLSSNRDGGTTGAVLWKITPLFAEWLMNSFLISTLDMDSTVLELGCGISGLVALLLAPRVGRYIITDQDYVFKLLKTNLEENALKVKTGRQNGKHSKQKVGTSASETGNIELMALDWETSIVSDLSSDGIDLVIGCDCIYNETLIDPFVRTCAEICRLKGKSSNRRAMCVIAQQLRSDTVFGEWLSAFQKSFRVWRVPDHLLINGLNGSSGFVIHIGILKYD